MMPRGGATANRVVGAISCHLWFLSRDRIPREGPIDVFLIPHSHCDPGWIFAYESKQYVTSTGKILDSVYHFLNNSHDSRFVWSETCYFAMWYDRQPVNVQNSIKEFAHSGRLEFVGGGWVQSDETLSTTPAIANQMTLGHDYLSSRLGVIPNVSWQIDVFGHTQAMGKLMASMGFNTIVLNRVPVTTKEALARARALEFLWETGSETAILAHILRYPYFVPFKHIIHQPIPIAVQRAAKLIIDLSHLYRSNSIAIPWGDDFAFSDADHLSKSKKILDQLNIQYANQIHARFSTASEYICGKTSSQIDLPHLNTSFMPYADNIGDWWTGFFTSRPKLKGLTRSSEALLQATEVFTVLSNRRLNSVEIDNLMFARQQSALLTHHDAITGTAKPGVVHDYEKRLTQAEKLLAPLLLGSVSVILGVNGNEKLHLFSPEEIMKNGNFEVSVANSLIWERNEVVCLKLQHSLSASIFDMETNEQVQAQLVPVIKSNQKGNLLVDNKEQKICWMVVVPGLGFRQYLVQTSNSVVPLTSSSSIHEGCEAIENRNQLVEFDNDGYLSRVHYLDSGEIHPISHKFVLYPGDEGGAYLFTVRLHWSRRWLVQAAINFGLWVVPSFSSEKGIPVAPSVFGLTIGTLYSSLILTQAISEYHIGARLTYAMLTFVTLWLVSKLVSLRKLVRVFEAALSFLQFFTSSVLITTIFFMTVLPSFLSSTIHHNTSTLTISGPVIQSVFQSGTPYFVQQVSVFNMSTSTPFSHITELRQTVWVEESEQISVRYSTSISNHGRICTDPLGTKELSCHDYDFSRMSSGNVMPLVTTAVIPESSGHGDFYVFLSQSAGVASLQSGQMEIMLHRRTINDDEKGLKGSLEDDDSKVSYTTHMVFHKDQDGETKKMALQLNHPLLIFVKRSTSRPAALPVVSFVPENYPTGVHLDTLQWHFNSSAHNVLLRLHPLSHMAATYSVDTKALLKPVTNLTAQTEMSLSLLHPRSAATPLGPIQLTPTDYKTYLITQSPIDLSTH
ncbi:alpha-mannosidase 2 [Pelomyxa schiedti]|nr:alpha-mannosidase 2 [Pelomyxa schiedti]